MRGRRSVLLLREMKADCSGRETFAFRVHHCGFFLFNQWNIGAFFLGFLFAAVTVKYNACLRVDAAPLFSSFLLRMSAPIGQFSRVFCLHRQFFVSCPNQLLLISFISERGMPSYLPQPFTSDEAIASTK